MALAPLHVAQLWRPHSLFVPEHHLRPASLPTCAHCGRLALGKLRQVQRVCRPLVGAHGLHEALIGGIQAVPRRAHQLVQVHCSQHAAQRGEAVMAFTCRHEFADKFRADCSQVPAQAELGAANNADRASCSC